MLKDEKERAGKAETFKSGCFVLILRSTAPGLVPVPVPPTHSLIHLVPSIPSPLGWSKERLKHVCSQGVVESSLSAACNPFVRHDLHSFTIIRLPFAALSSGAGAGDELEPPLTTEIFPRLGST